MSILKRAGYIVMALLLIILSLFFQCLFLGILIRAVMSAAGIRPESKFWPLATLSFVLVMVNVIACWEYFYKRRGQAKDAPNSMVVFLIPKALQLIWHASKGVRRDVA